MASETGKTVGAAQRGLLLAALAVLAGCPLQHDGGTNDAGTNDAPADESADDAEGGTAACTPGATQPCYGGPDGTAGVGICAAGTQSCGDDGQWGACDGQQLPTTMEVCGNGLDDDCNGMVDDGCGACTPGATRDCYSGPAATRGVGPCHGGTQTCAANRDWPSACAGEALPAATDTCGNGVDDDCNGMVDDACPVQRSCMHAGAQGCGLVQVAGGTFALGGDPSSDGGQLQRGDIAVDGFWTDAYEVTVDRFRTFYAAHMPAVSGAVAYPSGSLAIASGPHEPTQAANNNDCSWVRSGPDPADAHPVTCIDWYTAQAFCVWDGGRLPTEAEWEWLARSRPVAGTSTPRTYAWGDTMPGTSCPQPMLQWQNCAGEDNLPTLHVGSFPANGGIYDLTGSVWEHTADAFMGYDDTGCWPAVAQRNPLCQTATNASRTLRGGAYTGLSDDDIRAATRRTRPADDRTLANVGFRCVRSR